MDGNSSFMSGKAGTLYVGDLQYFRKLMYIRRVFFTLLLAAIVLAGIRIAWVIGHDRHQARKYDPVVYVAGGLIWIEEAEETWRVK